MRRYSVGLAVGGNSKLLRVKGCRFCIVQERAELLARCQFDSEVGGNSGRGEDRGLRGE